jgi:hypothetical protein
MCADLLFAFGFSITVLGIIQDRVGTVACGLIVAAFGRQTALANMIAIWVAFSWLQRHKLSSSYRIIAITLASVTVIAIYWVGGWFADGATNENLEHLTGLANWAVSDEPGKFRQLFDFALRGLVSQSPALILLIVLLAKRTQPVPIEFWIVALMVLSVWAQPILAGPNITGNNIVRLGSFAYIALLAMGALAAGESGKTLAPWAFWSIVIALGIGSFHHRWSWPGLMLLRTSDAFAILFASMALAVGIAANFGNSVASREFLISEAKS